VINIKNESRRIAEQIIKLLSDNRISINQWNKNIPLHIANQPFPIIVQAKNLADGINAELERKGLDIADEYLVELSGEREIHMDSESRGYISGINY
jgi:hypothetical protein